MWTTSFFISITSSLQISKNDFIVVTIFYLLSVKSICTKISPQRRMFFKVFLCINVCYYLEYIALVAPPQTWDTSNRPFSLIIAIAPPGWPSGAATVHAPRTAAPTRICAELLLLSSRTLAFLLNDSRWVVTLTSRCQACTVPETELSSKIQVGNLSIILPLLLQIQRSDVAAFIEIPLMSVGVAPRLNCEMSM